MLYRARCVSGKKMQGTKSSFQELPYVIIYIFFPAKSPLLKVFNNDNNQKLLQYNLLLGTMGGQGSFHGQRVTKLPESHLHKLSQPYLPQHISQSHLNTIQSRKARVTSMFLQGPPPPLHPILGEGCQSSKSLSVSILLFALVIKLSIFTYEHEIKTIFPTLP